MSCKYTLPKQVDANSCLGEERIKSRLSFGNTLRTSGKFFGLLYPDDTTRSRLEHRETDYTAK